MADRRISKRLSGNVMSTCVTPACLYGTETLVLTELVKARDGSAEELDRETGEEQTTWAGHVERMADDRNQR